MGDIRVGEQVQVERTEGCITIFCNETKIGEIRGGTKEQCVDLADYLRKRL